MEEHKKLISKLKEQTFPILFSRFGTHMAWSFRIRKMWGKVTHMAEEQIVITELMDMLEAEP